MTVNAQSKWNGFNRIQMGRITQDHLKLCLIEMKKRKWMEKKMEFGARL
jgi:hypothetical protein